MYIDYMHGTVKPNNLEELKQFCIKNDIEWVLVPKDKVLVESYELSQKELTHLKNMCSYVDIQFQTKGGYTFRDTKDTREKAVELFPSDLFRALQKYAIKNSEIDDILERIIL